MKEPTSEECSKNTIVYEDEHSVGYAIWYPQMGGYVGKCVVILDRKWTDFGNGGSEGGCFEAYVWHNGEFPFGESEDKPVKLHHCCPKQFISFGQKVDELNNKGRQINSTTDRFKQ